MGLCDPMTASSNITDVALCLALIGTEVLLCLCILKKHLFARLPWFSSYIFAACVQDLVQLAVSSWGSYTVYYYTFYATEYTVAALGLCTLVECGRQVLPGFKLPDKEKALAWLFVAIAGVVVFSTLWPMRFIENRLEVGAYLAIATTFIFTAAYARYLGLYWSRLLAGVCFPLGLHYLADGGVRAITWHYPYAFAVRFRELSPVVNIIATLAWIVVILSPWGEYDPTDEEIAQAKQIVDDIEANLRRFAAGGPQ